MPGRLYPNGYIGPLATSGGLVTLMREQLGKPIPWPVVLGEKKGIAYTALDNGFLSCAVP